MRDDIEGDVRKLKDVCKDRYRFDFYYTNNKVDKNNGYWFLHIYPYILGWKERILQLKQKITSDMTQITLA